MILNQFIPLWNKQNLCDIISDKVHWNSKLLLFLCVLWFLVSCILWFLVSCMQCNIFEIVCKYRYKCRLTDQGQSPLIS